MSGASISAEPPVREAPPSAQSGRWRRYGITAVFLAPAAAFLIVWIIYPAVYTIARSFFGREGFGEFVGIDNYETLFTDDNLVTAIRNNAIWVAVVPAAVTAIGLIFAVLTERISWSVAFKTVVFMPMAVSAFAAGVTWRIMYQQEPDRGAINAAIGSVEGIFSPAGVLSQAAPSSDNLSPTPGGGIELKTPIGPGDAALLGLTRIRSTEVPATAKQAVDPEPRPGEDLLRERDGGAVVAAQESEAAARGAGRAVRSFRKAESEARRRGIVRGCSKETHSAIFANRRYCNFAHCCRSARCLEHSA